MLIRLDKVSHSSFTRTFLRRCDDQTTDSIHRCSLGPLSVFGDWFPVERSPSARRAQGSHRVACRKNLGASDHRPGCAVLRHHHRTLVLQGAKRTGRPGACLAARRPQRLRQGVSRLQPDRASASAVPGASALELPTALRQLGEQRKSRPLVGAAMLLLHCQAFHADPWDGAQATAAEGAPGRRACSPAS